MKGGRMSLGMVGMGRSRAVSVRVKEWAGLR